MACSKHINTNESTINSFTDYTWLFWNLQKDRLVRKPKLWTRTKTSLELSKAKFEWLDRTAQEPAVPELLMFLGNWPPESWPLPRIWRPKRISSLFSFGLLACLILILVGCLSLSRVFWGGEGIWFVFLLLLVWFDLFFVCFGFFCLLPFVWVFF